MAAKLCLALYFLAHLALRSCSEENKLWERCPNFCKEELGQIGFPYKDQEHPADCGFYTVNCSKPVSKIQFKERGYWFPIERISQLNLILVNAASSSIRLDSPSCESIESFILPNDTPFSRVKFADPWTVYNCSQSLGISVPEDFNHTSCRGYDIYYATHLNNNFPFAQQCSAIRLPPLSPKRTRSNGILFSTNFTVGVSVTGDCFSCHYSGGQCKTNSKNEFLCLNSTAQKGHNSVLNLGLAATAVAAVVLVVSVCCLRKKFSSTNSILFWKKWNPTHPQIEAFLKNYESLHARRYSYLDVKKMTDFFKEKLGQGGFGSVYKGKLHDGSLVAVKVLNQSKANGEEFINEVDSISRTSHVNIVSLLGFCFEGAKRALVYEFMPNGSLEKFVFDENATENSHRLDWETYHQISLGIARGLEYLHSGCNTRILHFDIKPHNILLDVEFVPKISDFGLAKICNRKESVISSTMGPRGTAGYIAPEVFSRNFGGISYKSDVYSYGMMILEMVGGRKNINVRVDNTSEIYFPHWVYKRLERDEELRLQRIRNDEDRVRVRKMIITSLWCIQTDPSNRPAMSKVLEMLEGSLDSLQVPPKPFLYSPPRSPPANPSSTFE